MPDPGISHCHVYTYARLSFIDEGLFFLPRARSRAFAAGKYPRVNDHARHTESDRLRTRSDRGVKSSPLQVGVAFTAIEIRLGALLPGMTLSHPPIIQYKRRGTHLIRAKHAVYGDKRTRFSHRRRRRSDIERILSPRRGGESFARGFDISTRTLRPGATYRRANSVARGIRARRC